MWRHIGKNPVQLWAKQTRMSDPTIYCEFDPGRKMACLPEIPIRLEKISQTVSVGQAQSSNYAYSKLS
jgi:hypothetical protein